MNAVDFIIADLQKHVDKVLETYPQLKIRFRKTTTPLSILSILAKTKSVSSILKSPDYLSETDPYKKYLILIAKLFSFLSMQLKIDFRKIINTNFVLVTKKVCEANNLTYGIVYLAILYLLMYLVREYGPSTLLDLTSTLRRVKRAVYVK